MADPLVATALYAVTRGLLDFSTCDDSRRWWAGCRMRLRTAKLDLDQRVATLNAQRLFAELASGRVDLLQSQKLARQATYRLQELLKPWMRTQADGQGDDLDLLARWYIINARERLEQLGVDFGPLLRTDG